MKNTRRVLSILLSLALLLGLLPTAAWAAEGDPVTLDVSVGDVTISSDGSYILTGSTTTNTVTIDSGISADVTLRDLSIDVSGTENVCAFKIADDSMGDVTITLSGENILKSGKNCAGVQKDGSTDMGTLTIQGDGSLTAVGGEDAAGIGGGWNKNSANICVSNGTVTAIGGRLGAGIGGGYYGDGTNIKICGGTVVATGGEQAAGIGGGFRSSGVNIGIEGSDTVVIATGGYIGAGIGGGQQGYGIVTVKGGNVTAVGGDFGAGIGGGWIGDGYSDTHSTIVTIEGGNVSATGGISAPGIGGGAYSSELVETSISGGIVAAIGGDDAPGIGRGGGGRGTGSTINISGGTVDATGGVYTKAGGDLVMGAFDGEVIVSSSTVTVNGSTYSENDASYFTVSGGTEGTDYIYDTAAGTLTILTSTPLTIQGKTGEASMDTIIINDGVAADLTLENVNIYNGDAALKIADDSPADVHVALVGDNSLVSLYGHAALEKNGGADTGILTIDGDGSLTAIGGDGSAGIGGGMEDDCTGITINGGIVTAIGRTTGIGSGDYGTTNDITINGGVVIASSENGGSAIGDTTDSGEWTGIVFENNVGTVYGDAVLTADLTLSEGMTLTIPEGASLTVASGATLAATDEAAITNNGSIVCYGTLNTTVEGNEPNIVDTSTPDVFSIEDGSISISESAGVYTVSQGDKTYTVDGTTPITITGTSAANTITVDGAGTADAPFPITIRDLDIDVSSTGGYSSGLIIGDSPIKLTGGASVCLTLEGENNLSSGEYAAVVNVPEGTSLTITEASTGSLSAVAESFGAGIGGNMNEDSGAITIQGGTIYALGKLGAAIGGGCNGSNAGGITITGGDVTAEGYSINSGGPGIGGGGKHSNSAQTLNGGNITISGGVVRALGKPAVGSSPDGTDPQATIAVKDTLLYLSPLSSGDELINSDINPSINNSVVFEEGVGTVRGAYSLPSDFTLNADETLTVPSGATLTVPVDTTMTIYGDCTVEDGGTLLNYGTIYGKVHGTVTGDDPVDLIPYTIVTTEAELKAALQSDFQIRLGNDITLTGLLDIPNCGVIDGAGYALSGAGLNLSNEGELTLKNLTIRDSSTGAVECWYGTTLLRMEGCTIANCTPASEYKAAVENNYSSCTVVLTDCKFENNTAGYGALEIKGNSQLIRCEISGNRATSSGAGVVNGATWGNSSLTLEDCYIHDNTASYGGVTGGVVSLSGCTVSGNTGTNCGGIYAENISLNNSIVAGNYNSSSSASLSYTESLCMSGTIVAANYTIEADPATLSDCRYTGSGTLVVMDSVIGSELVNGGTVTDGSLLTNNGTIGEHTPADIFKNLRTDDNGAQVPIFDEQGKTELNTPYNTLLTKEPSSTTLVIQKKDSLSYDGGGMGYRLSELVTVVSSVPYTAYYALDQELSESNYLADGATDLERLGRDLELETGEHQLSYYIIREDMEPVVGSLTFYAEKEAQGTPRAELLSFDAAQRTLTKTNWRYNNFDVSYDGGVTWKQYEDWSGVTTHTLSDGDYEAITPEQGIAFRWSENARMNPSEPTVIAVTRQTMPTLTMTQPGDADSQGTLSGLDTSTMEYSTGGANWTACTDTSLSFDQGVTVFVRVKASGTALESLPAAYTVDYYGAEKEAVPNAAIDYINEMLTSLTAGANYIIAGAFVTADVDGAVPIPAAWLNREITIIKRGSADEPKTNNSEAQTLVIPARSSITVTATDESYPGAEDGKITTAGTWEYSADQTVWNDYSENTGLAAGTWYVRSKATSTAFHSYSAAVTVGSTRVAEATPTGTVEDATRRITGLAANGTYKLGGMSYTASASGALTILTAWYGGVIDVIKLGNGGSTRDSAAQYLTIPSYDKTVFLVTTDDGETITLMVPEGGKITNQRDGTITITGESVTIVDEEGNATVLTLPEGTGGVTADSDGTIQAPAGTVVTTQTGTEITLNDGGEITMSGDISIPGGGFVTVTDGEGTETTVTVPENGGEISVTENGEITVPTGTAITTSDGSTTTITEGTGAVKPDGSITFPEGGKVTITDGEGNTTEVTVEAGETIDPAAPPHVHSWAESWSKDAGHHWHECEAEGCDITHYAASGETGAAYGAHTENGGVVTTQPTLEAEGVKTYSCTICGYVMRTEAIEKLTPEHQHSFSEDWKSDAENHWHECDCGEKNDLAGHVPVTDEAVATTCTTPGKTEGSHCEVCGYVIAAQEEIPAVGHIEETIPGKPATCTEPGLTEGKKCSICGQVLTQQEEIPATGHAYGDYQHDETRHWQVCSVCDAATAKESHVYDDDQDATCNVCGYERTVTPPDPVVYTVTFDTQGGSEIAAQTVSEGGKVDRPADPTRSGYTFGGWYTEVACATAWDFENDAVTANITLYAKWTTISGSSSSGSSSRKPTVSSGEGGNVTASRDGSVAITPDEGYQIAKITVNGKEVDIPADGKLTGLKRTDKVVVTFEPMPTMKIPASERFTDVQAGAWYEDAVTYVVDKGLFNGTSDATFSPTATMTRGMLATVLYRAEGEPGALESIFSDVENGKWYTDGISWAAEKGIVAGYGNDLFGPEDDITREQLAVMLWRYAGEPETAGTLDGFNDAGQVSSYADTALRWAVEQEIVTGKGGGVLDPQGQATRSEVATMLMRYFTMAK